MLAAAFIASVGGNAHAQEDPALKLQQDLVNPELRRGEEVPTFEMADHIEGIEEVDSTLTGHAELRQGSSSIKADQIYFQQVQDTLFANGTVRLFHDSNLYSGPELNFKLDDYTGYFVHPEYQFTKTDGRGFAERVNFLNRDQAEFIQPVYTTCRPGNYEWYVKATTMDIDQKADEGVGRNATIYFQGVPILASPYISFPLSDERHSGFLPPTIGMTSNSGAEIMVPYYWNIAPNRDLTLYPRIMTRRGVQLGEDFRYLEPTFNGDIRYETMEDRTTGSERYSLAVLNNWSGQGVLAGFSSTIALNKVSDNNYFVDFSRTIAASSTRTLPRDAEISYNAPYWYLTARMLRYQTLEDSGNDIVRPYDKLPEILLHGARLDFGGVDYALDADLTRFSSPGLVGGDRLIINPSVAYPIVRPGWFVTPKVSYSLTDYNLSDQTPGLPNHFSRSLPTVSLDSGLNFERETDLFGEHYLQTLEPRLFYVRTPYRDQSQFPDFDSALPDFNFSQLFAENTFTGYDRIADANQLTAALTTRYLNPETGAELFRAALGQRFYLSEQRVTLPDTQPVDSRRSDMLAAIAGNVTKTVSVDSGVEYSPAIGGIAEANIGGRWSPGHNKDIEIEYRFLRDQIRQIDFSGQWPLGGGWYGVGRLNYSITDRRAAEALGGVEYSGCCWVLRFVAQRFVTGTVTSTTAFFVQLELNGFSKLGSNPLEALKRNVVGYEPINPPPPAASPFIHYE